MNYELMIILKPLLPEDIRLNIQSKIEELVKKSGGTVVSQDLWGKKHLAYPIKKHEEGYYIVYKLTLKPSAVKELDTEMKLTSDILRHLLTKLEK